MNINKKPKNKLLLLVLVLLLILTSCSNGTLFNKNHSEKDSSDNTETDAPDKNPGTSGISSDAMHRAQADFDAYLDELFRENVSQSSLTLNLRVENPGKYGITANPVCLDTFTADYEETAEDELTFALNSLVSHDRKLLSFNQQMTYDILKEYFENELYGLKNIIYYEPLSPTSGMHGELPVIFAEYSFRTKEDVDVCLELLKQVDDYFYELFLFEKKKAEQGCFMNENAFKQVTEQCLEVAGNIDHYYLTDIFKEKLSQLSFLNDSEKSDYIDKYAAAVKDKFIPAYQHLYDNLLMLKDYCHTVNPAKESNWVEYYKYLVKAYTGSNKTPEELIEATMQSLKLNMQKLYSVVLQDSNAFDNFENYVFPYHNDHNKALNYLIENMKGTFPEPKATAFQVKDVHSSLESLLAPAFYLLPPIDNLDANVIYINNSEEYKDMKLFATLAHEGYPGHLYQVTYFNATAHHPIRLVLDFSGYTEGWAKYTELFAYDFAGNYSDNPLDSTTANLFKLNEIIGFALYSRIDLGINYEGWSIDKARSFLAEYGFTDTGSADEIYYTVLNEPGVYLQYYIGYLEIMELQDYVMEKMGSDFTLYKFHQMLLSAGPCQFHIIKEYIDNCLSMT